MLNIHNSSIMSIHILDPLGVLLFVPIHHLHEWHRAAHYLLKPPNAHGITQPPSPASSPSFRRRSLAATKTSAPSRSTTSATSCALSTSTSPASSSTACRRASAKSACTSTRCPRSMTTRGAQRAVQRQQQQEQQTAWFCTAQFATPLLPAADPGAHLPAAPQRMQRSSIAAHPPHHLLFTHRRSCRARLQSHNARRRKRGGPAEEAAAGEAPEALLEALPRNILPGSEEEAMVVALPQVPLPPKIGVCSRDIQVRGAGPVAGAQAHRRLHRGTHTALVCSDAVGLHAGAHLVHLELHAGHVAMLLRWHAAASRHVQVTACESLSKATAGHTSWCHRPRATTPLAKLPRQPTSRRPPQQPSCQAGSPPCPAALQGVLIGNADASMAGSKEQEPAAKPKPRRGRPKGGGGAGAAARGGGAGGPPHSSSGSPSSSARVSSPLATSSEQRGGSSTEGPVMQVRGKDPPPLAAAASAVSDAAVAVAVATTHCI